MKLITEASAEKLRGDHVGHVYFILVAIGTICYGIFMLAHGMAYDAEKD